MQSCARCHKLYSGVHCRDTCRGYTRRDGTMFSYFFRRRGRGNGSNCQGCGVLITRYHGRLDRVNWRYTLGYYRRFRCNCVGTMGNFVGTFTRDRRGRVRVVTPLWGGWTKGGYGDTIPRQFVCVKFNFYPLTVGVCCRGQHLFSDLILQVYCGLLALFRWFCSALCSGFGVGRKLAQVGPSYVRWGQRGCWKSL